MPDRFDKAVSKVLFFEGGYVDNPYDPGGETNFGITKRLARRWGYEGDMKDMTENTAKEIYRDMFWKKYRINEIEDINIAVELMEEVVNMGAKIPILNLQKIYNKFSENTISEDGIIGSETINAVNSYEYPEDIFLWQNILQGNRYWDLTDENESLLRFLRGWGRRLELGR